MFEQWVRHGHFDRPSWFDRNQFFRDLRGWTALYGPEDPFWALTPDKTEHHLLAAQMMQAGLDDDSLTEPAVHRAHRHELLKLLCRKNVTLSSRRADAIEHVETILEHICGWDRLAARADQYQLDQPRAWYKQQPLIQLMRAVDELSPRELERAGYENLDQETYRKRVKREIMLSVLHHPELPRPELDWLAHSLVLMTTKIRGWSRPARSPQVLVLEEKALLLRHLIGIIEQARYAKVPMRALYSLPREARVLTSVLITCSKPEVLAPTPRQVWSGSYEDTAMRVVEEKEQQMALFFDKRLIKKEGRETYMALPLRMHPEADPIAALVRTLETFELKTPAVFEHMPRIVAGMFAAAQRDREAGLGLEGMFWDTTTGRRVCQLIGFNPENQRHRQRVMDVRRVLEAFELRREIETIDEAGNRQLARMSAPLLELRKRKLELTTTQREGLSQHHELRAWSIDDYLWKATLNEQQGGTPAFMLIDERAFQLDDRSSVSFNIYWTIINRAYMSRATHVLADQVSDQGVFCPRLGVLYDWSGLDAPHAKVKRIRKHFREALGQMVEKGLLLDWSCDVLEDKHDANLQEMLDARVKVVLPDAIVSIVLNKARMGRQIA